MNDLELMYLLEDNGYNPTFKNLAILKEGLETGEYIIEAGIRSARVAFNAATYRQDGVADARRALNNGRRRFNAAVAAVKNDPNDEINRRIVNDGPEIERKDSRNLKNAKRDRARETVRAFFGKDTKRKPEGNTASSGNNQASGTSSESSTQAPSSHE